MQSDPLRRGNALPRGNGHKSVRKDKDMKIKELFKKVEATNEIAKMFDDEYAIRVTDGNDGWEETFTNYDDFKKWVKEEINKPWADVLLGNDELKEQGQLDYYLDTHVNLIYVTERFTPDFEVVKKHD